jgi:hypothetical protein
MRYPKDKIKEAILHPDVEIRDRAVGYFAKSSAPDNSVMAQVIQAVKTHGRKDAYRLIGSARDLPQNTESIAWVIDELNDDDSKTHENYTYNLTEVLAHAEPALVLPRETDILKSRHFFSALRHAFSERLRMHSWDEATCWRELETFGAQASHEQSDEGADWSHADRVAEALARFGTACEQKAVALLGQKPDDERIAWMLPLVARLAGEARLASTIPLLITNLQFDEGDYLNEACARALSRIGTPEVLHAVEEAYPGSNHHFRLYATGPLEAIRSDIAVETCLRLLEQEQDGGIQAMLAQALLSQFAFEGIEAARRLLLRGELNQHYSRDLRIYLLETCKFMGEHFPEYEAWLAAEKAEQEEHWRIMKELEGDPQRQMVYALAKLAGQKVPDAVFSEPVQPATTTTRLDEPRQSRKKGKIGRNERCPCGSGKKFKVCCGRR